MTGTVGIGAPPITGNDLDPSMRAEPGRQGVRRAVLQEVHMAANEKEAYLALIAAQDPEIRTLLDQGFAFVTNTFKAGAAPSGMKARTDREHVRRLQQEGYQVAVTAAYDEQGQHRPSLSAIWRKKL